MTPGWFCSAKSRNGASQTPSAKVKRPVRTTFCGNSRGLRITIHSGANTQIMARM